MNIKLNYLYRDAGNYKQFHCVIFSNEYGYSLEEVDNAIRNALIDETWFDATKWGLKDIRPEVLDDELDHGWHEFEGVEKVCDVIEELTDISDLLKKINENLKHSFKTDSFN